MKITLIKGGGIKKQKMEQDVNITFGFLGTGPGRRISRAFRSCHVLFIYLYYYI